MIDALALTLAVALVGLIAGAIYQTSIYRAHHRRPRWATRRYRLTHRTTRQRTRP